MRKKREEKDKNPLYTEHGLFSNIRYILHHMISCDRQFLLLIPLGIVCAPAMQYLWTFISKFVIDMITGERSVKQLALLMLLFTMLQIAATMANTFFNGETWWRYVYTRFCMIREKNYKIMTMDFECLEDADILDCYQKATNVCNANLTGIEGLMREIVNFLMSLSVVVVGIAILSTMNVYVMLFITGMSSISFYISNRTNRTLKRTVWDPLAAWWRKNDYMQHVTTDAAWAKDIRMFGLRDWLVDKYHELNRTRLEAQKTNERYWMRANNAAAVLWSASQIVVYGCLIYFTIQGEITIANASLYLTSSATFSEYITKLLEGMGNMLTKSREVDDFRSFLEFRREENQDTGREVEKANQYEFVFKNVSFKYPKAENYALKNLNLTVRAGERLAVVGTNGAGKSTFIKLLLRLYEPTEGEILLNGVNIREYNKKSYYAIFAPVFQNVELFAFPLAENVSMKLPKETDKKRAEEMLIQAGMGKKLASLPKGIDTELLKIIYDDGVDLSGGEKQKLALARALYKDAPVVVLDEPTAALDALAESRLYEDFDRLIGGKTAVYISHRLSSTQFCQHVAMFCDGEMVEYGTHTSLLEKGGSYAEMFKVQAQYYIENPESGVAENVV